MKKWLLTLVVMLGTTPSWGDVEINETNFPDDNFRQYLLDYWGQDGVLSDEEIAGTTNLFIPGLNISSLKGIEYFTALTGLSCYGNQLTALDLSANTALTTLQCNDNQLASLTLPTNSVITSFSCYHNQLKGETVDAIINALPQTSNTALNFLLSGIEGNFISTTQVAAAKAKGWIPKCGILYSYGGTNWQDYSGGETEGIEISEANFPDEKFRNFLRNNIWGIDGWLSEADIPHFESVGIEEKSGLTSLKGIEHLTAMRSLYCRKNLLTSLDVSQNTALTSLVCDHNQITALDLSKNTALSSLVCNNNQLTALDVSKNTALSYLTCDDNSLTALDLSKNAALHYLDFHSNNITTIDLTNNPLLSTLECHNNNMTALDVTKNTELGTLRCDNNLLETLDLSKNSKLTIVKCAKNQLSALDVSAATQINELDCSSNQLSSLDISKNAALKQLYCYNNQLTTLNVTENNLSDLRCYNNQITSLNLSNSTSLYKLECYNNSLTTLSLAKDNTSFRELYCDNNKLTSLDVTGCTNLKYLHCYCNQIKGTEMDAFVTSLPQSRYALYVIFNENEANEMTEAQVAAAKAKGWYPCYFDGTNWLSYEGTTGIPIVSGNQTIGVSYYTLDGKRMASPQRGINILRMSGGRTKKILVK